MRTGLTVLVLLLPGLLLPVLAAEKPKVDIKALAKACEEGDADACKKKDAYHEDKGRNAVLGFFGVKKKKKDCKDGKVKKKGVFCPIPGNKFKKKKGEKGVKVPTKAPDAASGAEAVEKDVEVVEQDVEVKGPEDGGEKVENDK